MGIPRQYELQATHTLRREFAYNTNNIANGVLIGTVPAGSRIQHVRVWIDIAFANGSVQGGTTGTGTNLFTNTDSAPTATGPKTPAAADGQGVGLRITSDQDLFVSVTGGATAGTGGVVVEYVPLTNGG